MIDPAQPGGLKPADRDGGATGLGDLYPFASHYLNVGGLRLHYVDEGDGPPIVLVHGNPTWSFYYRDLIIALRDRHRVIVPDHIGCGLSDKPQNYAYTLSTHIDNLERLIDRLGVDRVTLGVHDWGGAIGFGWAMRHADRVRRFMVFNTAAFLGARTPLRIRVCRRPILGEVAVRCLNGFVLGALYMASTRRGGLSRAVKGGYVMPYDSFANRVAVLRFIRDIPMSPADQSYALLRDIEDALPRFVDRPMVLCWGMKDFCFDERFLRGWQRRFPNAAVHRFEDAGHYVVEDAHERMLPILEAFLRQTED